MDTHNGWLFFCWHHQDVSRFTLRALWLAESELWRETWQLGAEREDLLRKEEREPENWTPGDWFNTATGERCEAAW